MKKQWKYWIKAPKINSNNAFEVRFRQVGQGDTIILEAWLKDKLHLGIIDCKNDYNKENAVKSYLQHLRFWGIDFKISFIIISHPHNDHFSGIAELIDFIRNENIQLDEIAHTFNVHSGYAKTGRNPHETISSIRTAIEQLKQSNTNLRTAPISYHTTLWLTPEIYIKTYAPEDTETNEFIDKSNNKKYPNSTSKLANILSTVLSVSYKNKYVLLTSDAEKKIFPRILTDLPRKIGGQILQGAQIPHHGSKENFHEDFWTNVRSELDPQAVISAGPDDNKHPADYVTTYLDRIIKYKLTVTKDKLLNSKKNHKGTGALLIEVSEYIDGGEDDAFIKVEK